MARRHWIEVAVIATVSLTVGCATGLPAVADDQLSMRDILKRHTPTSHSPLPAPQRSARRESIPFPLLDNPILLLWLHPHFSGGAEPLPVPGYITALPLYARDHFALPGESDSP